ncbi:MAG: AbrB family transcriptional regulator [Spirochaetaceae bacterium]|jgi:membrane AbrB-like protein|nr:AbrB family transcriptional regulator [Spirochaetaceae bacterium]
MPDLILFFGIGVSGWVVCEKLKIPAPAILGSLLFLGIAAFFDAPIAPPAQLRSILSVVVGIILGLRFNVSLAGMVREILLSALWLIALTVLAVIVLSALGIDRTTAIFAATPGGITEITLTAMSFGANTFAVAILQLSRMLLTVTLIPFLVRRPPEAAFSKTASWVASGGMPPPASPKEPPPQEPPPAAARPLPLRMLDWAILAALGAFSAWLFGLVRFPASNMVGPMLVVGAYTWIRKRKVKVHKNLQKLVQVGVGGLVGLSITRASILALPSYILPIICLNIIIVGGCIMLAYVLHKLTGWDILTCLIATAPGGLSLMTLMSVEMGADSNRVVVFQVLRMVLVLLLTPFFGGLSL